MSNIVQAIESFSTTVGRAPVSVSRGDLFHDTDLVVKKCPSYFANVQVRSTRDNSRVREPLSGGSVAVAATETAVATPGVKRSIGRPKKSEPEPSEV